MTMSAPPHKQQLYRHPGTTTATPPPTPAAQVVSELHGSALKPTLAVAYMGQCAGIWRMARVGPDGTHGMAYGTGTGRADVR